VNRWLTLCFSLDGAIVEHRFCHRVPHRATSLTIYHQVEADKAKPRPGQRVPRAQGKSAAASAAAAAKGKSGTKPKPPPTPFLLIAVPDATMTLDSLASALAPLLAKHPDGGLLLLGPPGLPHTHWPRGLPLTAAAQADACAKLLRFLCTAPAGRGIDR